MLKQVSQTNLLVVLVEVVCNYPLKVGNDSIGGAQDRNCAAMGKYHQSGVTKGERTYGGERKVESAVKTRTKGGGDMRLPDQVQQRYTHTSARAQWRSLGTV